MAAAPGPPIHLNSRSSTVRACASTMVSGTEKRSRTASQYVRVNTIAGDRNCSRQGRQGRSKLKFWKTSTSLFNCSGVAFELMRSLITMALPLEQTRLGAGRRCERSKRPHFRQCKTAFGNATRKVGRWYQVPDRFETFRAQLQ